MKKSTAAVVGVIGVGVLGAAAVMAARSKDAGSSGSGSGSGPPSPTRVAGKPGDGAPGTTFVAWYSYTGASGQKRWIQIRQYGDTSNDSISIVLPLTAFVMTRAVVEADFQWLVSLSENDSTPLAQGDIHTEGSGYNLDRDLAIASARDEAIRKAADVAVAWIDSAFKSEDA